MLNRSKVKACAVRGTGGSYWKNGIEIRNDGCSNALTTTSKDALYIAEVKEVDDDFMNPVEEDIVLEEEDTGEKIVEDYLHTAKDGEMYGVFKLSPRECLRLMGVKDSDIDKMAAVNSNTQLYKQAGNSIIVPVLCAIFSQLNIKGCKAWNEMSDEERDRLIMPEPIVNEYTQEAILIKPEKCKEIAGG